MARPRKPGRGEVDPPPVDGYPTAWDLPTYKKLASELQGLKLLTLFSPTARGELRDLEGQMNRIVETVEKFYELLGDDHWVFHESFSLDILSPALEEGTAEALQRAVIAHYQDEARLDRWIMQASFIPGMRERATLLQLAGRDYHEGRYYSVVLVLLTVIDGFVNGVGTRPVGLHARRAPELVGWDSWGHTPRGSPPLWRPSLSPFRTRVTRK